MKPSLRIFLAALVALHLTSCGKDPDQVNLEKKLRSGEAYVSELLQQTIATREGSIPAQFAGDMTPETYLQSIQQMETRVGEFKQLDLVEARWNPAEVTELEPGENEAAPIGDTVKVTAIVLSGEKSGATLKIFLKPENQGWNVVAMEGETTSENPAEDIPEALSQTN